MTYLIYIFLPLILSCFLPSVTRAPIQVKSSVRLERPFIVANGVDSVKVELDDKGDGARLFYRKEGESYEHSLQGDFSTSESGTYEVFAKSGTSSGKVTKIIAIPTNLTADVPFARKNSSDISVKNLATQLGYGGFENYLRFYFDENEIKLSKGTMEGLARAKIGDKSVGAFEVSMKLGGHSVGRIRVIAHQYALFVSFNEGKFADDSILILEGSVFDIREKGGAKLSFAKRGRSISLETLQVGEHKIEIFTEFEGSGFLIERANVLIVPKLFEGFEIDGELNLGEKILGETTIIPIITSLNELSLSTKEGELYLFHKTAKKSGNEICIIPLIVVPGESVCYLNYYGRPLFSFRMKVDKKAGGNIDEWFGLSNVGNSCYLNASLKSLFRVLSNIDIEAEEHSLFVEHNPVQKEESERLRKLIVGCMSSMSLGERGAKEYSGALVKLIVQEYREVQKAFGNTGLKLVDCKQEDADELLISLVEFLDLGNCFTLKVEGQFSVDGLPIMSPIEDSAHRLLFSGLESLRDGSRLVDMPSDFAGGKRTIENFNPNNSLTIPKIVGATDYRGNRIGSQDVYSSVNDLLTERGSVYILEDENGKNVIFKDGMLVANAEVKEDSTRKSESAKLWEPLALLEEDTILISSILRGQKTVRDEELQRILLALSRTLDKTFIIRDDKSYLQIRGGNAKAVEIDADSLVNLQLKLSNTAKSPYRSEDFSYPKYSLKTKDHFLISYDREVVIKSTPRRLILGLKRFMQRGMVSSKVNTRIVVGEEYSLNGEDYKLVAYICHSGNVNGGHYWAFIESNGKWYKHNDSSVVESSMPPHMEEDGSAEPYILFYERVN